MLRVLATAFAIACQDQAPIPGAGAYTLVAVSGLPLPYQWNSGDTLQSGRLLLHHDHALSEIQTNVGHFGAQRIVTTDTQRGTWTLIGTSFDLVYGGGLIHTPAVLNVDNSITRGVFRFVRE